MIFRKLFRRGTALLLLLCALFTLIPQPVSAEEATAEPVPQQENLLTASVVHYGPSAGYAVIGCVENGSRLTVLGEKRDYLKIDCFEMKGYIAKSQTRKGEDGEYYVNCAEGAKDTKYLPVFSAQETLEMRSEILSIGKKYIGAPYVSGGTSPRGFDCCGYVQYVYQKAGLSLSRTQCNQMTEGLIIGKKDLQPGDLVFFKNTTSAKLLSTHVGIYIGNGKMLHAAGRATGVVIGDVNSSYFTQHYLCARRVIVSDLSQSTLQPALGLGQTINSSYWREGSQTSGLGASFLRKIFTGGAVSDIICQNDPFWRNCI